MIGRAKGSESSAHWERCDCGSPPVCVCASRSEEGRPRLHLHAHDRGAGGGHAGMRAHRGCPLHCGKMERSLCCTQMIVFYMQNVHILNVLIVRRSG